MIAFLVAKWALAKADLARLPRWAWYVIAATALIVGGYFLHQHYAHKIVAEAVRKAVDSRDGQWRASLAKARAQALQQRTAAEQQAAKITKELNDENARLRARIAGDAGRLLHDGPGAAACRGQVDHSGVSGSASADRPATQGSTAVVALPSAEGSILFGLPPAGAVALAAQHDWLRAYYITDRRWHEQQAAAWEKYRAGGR